MDNSDSGIICDYPDHMVIKDFRGDFEYLSNFYRGAPFKDEGGTEWQTVEHYYQAQKTTHPDWKKSIYSSQEPGDAKKLGGSCPKKKDWDFERTTVMYEAVKMKFTQNLDIAKKLVSTYSFLLVEGNYWHDNFWGDCRCRQKTDCVKTGFNQLGKILMRVRDELMEDKSFMAKIVKEG